MNRLAWMFVCLSSTCAAFAGPNDVCKIFSADDVHSVLGAPPAKPGVAVIPGSCSWSAPGVSLTIADTDVQDPAAALQALEASRARAAKSDAARDEPGLGQRAVSIVEARGRSIDLFVASGSHLWRFGVEGVDKKLETDRILPALRAAARKALRPSA